MLEVTPGHLIVALTNCLYFRSLKFSEKLPLEKVVIVPQ